MTVKELLIKLQEDISWLGYNETEREIVSHIQYAIELLKEQETVKPEWSQGKAYCGNCGQKLPRKSKDKEINYCGYCGQGVKWE